MPTTGFLAIALAAIVTAASANDFAVFDASPAALSTQAMSVNSAGQVAGYFFESGWRQRGFLRNPDGRIVVFDPPGSDLTETAGINDSGVIAGAFWITEPGGVSRHRGYLRDAGGNFVIFDPPNSQETRVTGVNNAGQVTGQFLESGIKRRGFIRNRDGSFEIFDAPNASFTLPVAISDAGESAGMLIESNYRARGFVRDKHGRFEVFEAFPTGINFRGEVTGYAVTESQQGFVRNPGGHMTLFGTSGSHFQPAGITFFNVVAGTVTSQTSHGFLRTRQGGLELFDPPNSSSTQVRSISNSGAVTGTFYDTSVGKSRSFLRRP